MQKILEKIQSKKKWREICGWEKKYWKFRRRNASSKWKLRSLVHMYHILHIHFCGNETNANAIEHNLPSSHNIIIMVYDFLSRRWTWLTFSIRRQSYAVLFSYSEQVHHIQNLFNLHISIYPFASFIFWDIYSGWFVAHTLHTHTHTVIRIVQPKGEGWWFRFAKVI